MALQSSTALATITLQAARADVTFSGIPTTYRDLILSVSGEPTAGGGGVFRIRVNGDSASNYSIITAEGSANGAQSGTLTTTQFNLSFHRSTVIDGFFNPHVIQFVDYGATDKHKTVLVRANAHSNGVIMTAGRWASTSAISSITVFPESGSWDIGSTFSLYGRIA